MSPMTLKFLILSQESETGRTPTFFDLKNLHIHDFVLISVVSIKAKQIYIFIQKIKSRFNLIMGILYYQIQVISEGTNARFCRTLTGS